MYPDGICKVTANTFSKCIEFADISYQLAQADTKTAIFENLCDLYNYLDASIHVQFSFVNRKTDPKQYAKSFEIKAQGDDFDDIRAEYSGILQDQLVRGNNGLTKRKFLTFTIEADNLKMARARLTRIETDLLGYFKTMGAVAHVLDAKERLEVLHGVLHPDAEPFQFEWKWLAPSGLSTKDFIAPSSFRFGNSRMFGLGGKYGAVSFLNILSPELSDEMLADFLNTENGIVVNLHVQAIDQSEAIKTVKRKITDLDAMKIQEQKRAVRSGYDMDILPSDLATYGQDAKELLKTLQSRNERMFQITFLVMNTADTRQKLENDVFWAAGVAQKYNCSLVRLDYQQEQGLMSSLPLGANHIKIERSLTTSSVAVFVPFVTQELFMGGDAMYYGVNAKTGNMIMLDRKRARCPNGLKLGTPGSGKSMSCKSEIVSVFLCTPDDVYICDPEAEYYYYVAYTITDYDNATSGSGVTTTALSNRTGHAWNFNFSDSVSGKSLPMPPANYAKGATTTRPSNLADTYYNTYTANTGVTLNRSLYDVHHIRPLAYGGSNAYSNLIHLPKATHTQVTSWWAGY